MRKLFAMLLALVMVVSILPMAALAEEVDIGIEPYGSGKEDEEYLIDPEQEIFQVPLHNPGSAGSTPISPSDQVTINYIGVDPSIDLSSPNSDYAIWHFNDERCNGNGATPLFAMISFNSGDLQEITWSGKQGFYYVVTPSNWTVTSGYAQSKGYVNGNNANNFNISGSYKHEPEMGKVAFSGTVDPYHILTTTNNYYNVVTTHHYTVTTHDVYNRDVTDVYQRYASKVFVPVFEKKLAGAYNDTLVTRLDYSDNTAKAIPTNGGAFKNGHTYVTVNVAEASSEEGVWFTIADSSKNNGKKTPDAYNMPIDYKYNVKIADGKLTVSCDDRLAYASVGAYVYDTAPKDAKNAPKHALGSYTVDLPKNDGTVDLYVHFEKLGWYEVDTAGNYVYQFKEWQYDHTEYGRDWVYVETIYGTPVFEETIKDEKVEVGEPTITEEYDDSNTTTQEVHHAYDGTLTFTVTGEGYSQTFNEGATLELNPGEYTFTMSGSGFDDVSETVTIVAGQNSPVSLSATFYDADKDESKTEKKTTNITGPDDIQEVADDDIINDNEPTTLDKEEYIYRPDMHMGSEDDPFGEYAVRK